LVVVAIPELHQGAAEFHEIPETMDPQELFFQRAKKALDASGSSTTGFPA
jgi:hypothetical protein